MYIYIYTYIYICICIYHILLSHYDYIAGKLILWPLWPLWPGQDPPQKPQDKISGQRAALAPT